MTTQRRFGKSPFSRAQTLSGRRHKTSKLAVDFDAAVDEAFVKRIVVTENGKQSRITVFEAIYRRLLQSEMAGDSKAFRVRLIYEKFAREMTPFEEPKTRVIGGLPDLDGESP